MERDIDQRQMAGLMNRMGLRDTVNDREAQQIHPGALSAGGAAPLEGDEKRAGQGMPIKG